MMAVGASSPPIASMAMRNVSCSYQLPSSVPSSRHPNRNWMAGAGLRLFDLPDLAALVVAAVRAHLVRRLRLLALRAGAGRHRLRACRACGASRCASSNAAVLDWASAQFSLSLDSSDFSGASRGSSHLGAQSHGRLVQIGAALGTETAAGLLAERLHRQRQHELLAHQLDRDRSCLPGRRRSPDRLRRPRRHPRRHLRRAARSGGRTRRPRAPRTARGTGCTRRPAVSAPGPPRRACPHPAASRPNELDRGRDPIVAVLGIERRGRKGPLEVLALRRAACSGREACRRCARQRAGTRHYTLKGARLRASRYGAAGGPQVRGPGRSRPPCSYRIRWQPRARRGLRVGVAHAGVRAHKCGRTPQPSGG